MTDNTVYSRLFGVPGGRRKWLGIFSSTDQRKQESNNSQCDDNGESDYATLDELVDDGTYLVRQQHGYLSILFSVVQVVILVIMMFSGDGVAPLNVNPMIGPYPETLNDWGAKNTELIVHDGEWWRLITPIFLHAGVIHIVGNVAVQLDIGRFFEREWGSIVWLILYMGSGLGSSILSAYAFPETIGVGSSGAVCGLFGAKLSEVFCRSCASKKTEQGRIGHEIRNEQCKQITCSVIIVGLFSFVPMVDWAAHLGGFVTGATIGMVFFSLMIKRKEWMVSWCIVGIVSTFVAFSWGLRSMYGDDHN